VVPFRDSSGSYCPLHGSVTRTIEARVRVSPHTRFGWSIRARSCLTIAPQPAHETLRSQQPAHPGPHPADARHRALAGATAWRPLLSERSSLSPGKRLHHQGALVPTTLAPTPRVSQRLWQGGKDPLNSAFLAGVLPASSAPPLQPGAPHSSLGTYLEMTQNASLFKPACCTSWT
jgi:hypothetical protein